MRVLGEVVPRNRQRDEFVIKRRSGYLCGVEGNVGAPSARVETHCSARKVKVTRDGDRYGDSGMQS